MKHEPAPFGEQFAVIQKKKMLEESRKPRPEEPREILDNAMGQKQMRDAMDNIFVEPV